MGKRSFGDAPLKDIRRTCRLVRLAGALARVPGGTMTSVMTRTADIKAAYRLLDCEEVTHAAVCQSHCAKVRDWCREPGTYLMIEDTTTLSYPGLDDCFGLGPVGEDHTRGFFAHSTVAVRWSCSDADAYVDEARVVGLAQQQVWARDPEASRRKETRAQRYKRADLESDRWAKMYEECGGPGDSGAQWIHVGDRESDIFEVFERCRRAQANFVVRALQDRALADQAAHVHAAMAQGKLMGRRIIELAAGPGRPARTATLEVRACVLNLRGPYRAGGSLEDMTVHGVEVREINAPAGQEPVYWMLLTDLPIESEHNVWKIVAIYKRRWLIEEYHKAIKTGVGLEKSQLKDVRKLMALAGILSVVSVWLVDMKLEARMKKDMPLRPEQADAATLEILENKTGKPKGGWNSRTLLVAIAKLGGYLARKHDGPPGWQTIWRGWQRLMLLSEGYHLARPAIKGQRSG
jgi:hypothetical protein